MNKASTRVSLANQFILKVKTAKAYVMEGNDEKAKEELFALMAAMNTVLVLGEGFEALVDDHEPSLMLDCTE